jgi:hypothetical protein
MLKFFTITARNYLSLALSLGDSIAKQHPDAEFLIVVADGLDDLDIENIKYKLISAEDVVDNDLLFRDLAFKYNITEFCTSIKPFVFELLYKSSNIGDVLFYFDPDTYLFSSANQILNGADEKNLFLTPHIIDCSVDYIHTYPEYKHLWEGIFNLGFCGIRKRAESKIIIDWWKQRLIDYCYADYNDGLHTDQKWMDYAPVYFSDQLCIVKHYGCNVSHWNIDERDISINNGLYSSNDQDLVFFHFSGFDFKNKSLTKHVAKDKQNYLENSSLNKLAVFYRNTVHDNGYELFIAQRYEWNFFNDGTPITALHRRFYRELKLPITGNPFFVNSAIYELFSKNKLLSNNEDAHGNYSKQTVNNLDDKVKKVERILRIIRMIIGNKYYTYLVKLFSRYSRFENHVFLLKNRK